MLRKRKFQYPGRLGEAAEILRQLEDIVGPDDRIDLTWDWLLGKAEDMQALGV